MRKKTPTNALGLPSRKDGEGFKLPKPVGFSKLSAMLSPNGGAAGAPPSGGSSGGNGNYKPAKLNNPSEITPEEVAWAQDILATHLDACLRQDIHPDLTEAVEEAISFAMRHEKASGPIPQGARRHSALVVMEERDVD